MPAFTEEISEFTDMAPSYLFPLNKWHSGDEDYRSCIGVFYTQIPITKAEVCPKMGY